MTRLPTLIFCLLLLVGCSPALDNDRVPPDGESGDDDDSTVSDDLEDLWETLDPGVCDVVPDNGSLLPYGEGRATTGLWYEVACWWIGGNASQITLQFDYFDERNGGDFDLVSIDVRDTGGTFVSVDGDFGQLHLLAGDDGTLNGWWEGDLSGVDPSGQAVQLDAVVFRDAFVDSVVSR